MASFKNQIHKCLSTTIAIKKAKGEFYKAKLMERALTNILAAPVHNITSLESVKGVGPMTLRKCKTYIKSGTTPEIEDYKTNPLFVFLKIHGVGLKKAQELIKEGITSIEMLRSRQDLLNDVQKKGLSYFEDINQLLSELLLGHSLSFQHFTYISTISLH